MRVVYKEASGTGWEGQCCLGLISRADGDRLPFPVFLCVIFQRLILGVGGAQEVQTLPQAVTPAFWWCPSLFLYYELSTPALWWDMETGLGYQGQDQDSGHGPDQGRGCSPSL